MGANNNVYKPAFLKNVFFKNPLFIVKLFSFKYFVAFKIKNINLS